MSGMDSTNGRVHLLGPKGKPVPKTDAHGRVLTHNATVQDVYDIVQEECSKVHEYYLQQIPQYAAKMIQDALLDLGLCKVVAGDDNVPMIVAASDPRPAFFATAEAPVETGDAIPASGDTAAADTMPTDSEGPEAA
jgi:hypothetical protein